MYARYTNGFQLPAEVGARAVHYADGWCGVDVDIVTASVPSIIRRVRYYHVNPLQKLIDKAGTWVALGALPANGSCSVQVGSVWQEGKCSSADGWAHVHLDTADTDKGRCSGGTYEWINETLPKNTGTGTAPLDPSTQLFHL